MSIPIVVGVTGHRDLRAEDIPTLKQTVRTELQKLQAAYPHSPFVMLSSLAAGADTLCAEIGLELGMRLVCPLPFAESDYRANYSDTELTTFDTLLASATDVFVVEAVEPARPDMTARNFCYRQAGIYIATHCHVLLALWDGSPSRIDGCGTAEAVDFMLTACYAGAAPYNAEGDGAVIHIATPRASKDVVMPITARLVEERAGYVADTLARTDEFNADCAPAAAGGAARAARAPSGASPAENTARATEDRANDASITERLLKRLRTVYDDSDRLSMECQTRYLRTLWALSLFCVLLVVAFLLYDAAALLGMLIAWGVIIVAYAVFYGLVLRGKYHQKYIQYRVLAEAMRVQMHLTSLGIAADIGSDFTWTQRHDVAWVRKAVDVLLIGGPGPATATPDEVKTTWVDEQLVYHENACKRDGAKLHTSDRVTQGILVATVAVFLGIAVMEFGTPDVIETPVFGLTVREWAKILWGCLSAVALFVSGYYGRLSFERKAFDHEKMALLFAAAARRYEQSPSAYETIFRQLAREEIIENGNWMSYCKEDRPTFSL